MKLYNLSEIILRLVGSFSPTADHAVDKLRMDNLNILSGAVEDTVVEILRVAQLDKTGYASYDDIISRARLTILDLHEITKEEVK